MKDPLGPFGKLVVKSQLRPNGKLVMRNPLRSCGKQKSKNKIDYVSSKLGFLTNLSIFFAPTSWGTIGVFGGLEGGLG
jgi:hypothetical protein